MQTSEEKRLSGKNGLRVVVTGATGFIGRPLVAALLGRGHSVTALSRSRVKAERMLGPGVTCREWGGAGEEEWRLVLDGADAVVHLAGESISVGRWSPEVKARLRTSRVDTTRRLVDALLQASERPKALISTSAAGWYGDRGDEVLTEASPRGEGFLADLCAEWESEALRAAESGVRAAVMRVGIVMGDGGALRKMLYPFPVRVSPWMLGLGGPLGSGRQYVPWIHLNDAVGLFAASVEDPEYSGPVNLTGPEDATARGLARSIGRALHRPAVLPVPAFALRMMLGEFAGSLLASQRLRSTVAERSGFAFQYPTLDAAVAAAVADIRAG